MTIMATINLRRGLMRMENVWFNSGESWTSWDLNLLPAGSVPVLFPLQARRIPTTMYRG